MVALFFSSGAVAAQAMATPTASQWAPSAPLALGLVFLTLIAATILFFQIFGWLILNYRLTSDALVVSFFYFLPIRTAPFNQIASVEFIPWRRALVFILFENWRSRLLADCVLINMGRERLPILISPWNAKEFAAKLTGLVGSSGP